MPTIDPYQLGIFERLEKHPETYEDWELIWLMERYEGRSPKGRNARIPAQAFLILEQRRSDDYTKEKE